MTPLSTLLGLLQGRLKGSHLVDKTGLTGRYDFKLEFMDPGAQPGATDIRDPIPDVFTALEKQLGLRLEKAKVPVDVLVIDHIEKAPTAN
jgi:uncharacterized protein (TIGR03435 family)